MLDVLQYALTSTAGMQMAGFILAPLKALGGLSFISGASGRNYLKMTSLHWLQNIEPCHRKIDIGTSNWLLRPEIRAYLLTREEQLRKDLILLLVT